VREAVDAVGGSETALARYRVGHAHYVEGRRAFTSAMGCFGDEEWMMAQGDFTRAYEAFEEAADQFNTAVRFGEEERYVAHFERAEDKAELLWQAAEWLTEAASAFASGEGAQGQAMRTDAEAPLEEARRYGEPLDPDDFPPEEAPPPLEDVGDESDSFLPDDEDEVDTTLEVDLDDDAYADEELRESVEDSDGDAETTADGAVATAEGGDGTESAAGPTADAESGHGDGRMAEGGSGDAGDQADGSEEEASIDEAELEEITAELEQQTEAAEAEYEREQAAAEAEAGETDRESSEGVADADDAGGEVEDSSEGEADDEDVELDLTDPTDGEGLDPLEDDDEDEDPDEDLGDDGGGHGVPDSL
jgi:hypothetical protein